MNSLSKVKSYIDSVIPENITKNKKRALYDELLCHIIDRTDYYKEIGYSEEQSIDKAIEHMGTDDGTKSRLSNEFEELYHERTWWAFIPSVIILLMNYLCFPLDVWVTSADYNDDPTGWKILVSFAMLFICFAFIRFAEIKRFRKMLMGIGISNLIIAASLLCCFYPQAALYAVEQNFYLVLDKCTPFTLNPEYFGLYYYVAIALLIIIFIYCIIQSVRIKRGTAGKKKRTVTVVLTVCYAVFTVFTTSLYPVSTEFVDNYPVYFDWLVYSSEESEELYRNIKIGEAFEEANAYLNCYGWFTLSDYEAKLDKNTAKKFRAMCKDRADFGSDYIIWYNPELNIDGNGFVFAKLNDENRITEKGTGNPLSFNPTKDSEFRYYYRYGTEERLQNRERLQNVEEDWENMKTGDSREDVMSRFGTEYGTVYSYMQNENSENFAVFVCGSTEDNKDFSRYIVLSFSDGKLIRGDMYWHEFNGKESELCKYSVE